jgi:hypothetical protein
MEALGRQKLMPASLKASMSVASGDTGATAVDMAATSAPDLCPAGPASTPGTGMLPEPTAPLAFKWTVALVLRKRKCRIVRSLSPLHGQLPAIAIEIVKPKTHMG